MVNLKGRNTPHLGLKNHKTRSGKSKENKIYIYIGEMKDLVKQRKKLLD